MPAPRPHRRPKPPQGQGQEYGFLVIGLVIRGAQIPREPGMAAPGATLCGCGHCGNSVAVESPTSSLIKQTLVLQAPCIQTRCPRRFPWVPRAQTVFAFGQSPEGWRGTSGTIL